MFSQNVLKLTAVFLMIGSAQIANACNEVTYLSSMTDADSLKAKVLKCNYNGIESQAIVSVSIPRCKDAYPLVKLTSHGESMIVTELKILRGTKSSKYIFNTEKVDGISCVQISKPVGKTVKLKAEPISSYYYISGGFGKDGATNQADPQEDSIESAFAIYNALDVEVNDVDKKFAGFEWDGDTFGIECKEDDCSIKVLVKINPDQKFDFVNFNKDITFTGKTAESIFAALIKSAPMGSSTVSVANLSCTNFRSIRDKQSASSISCTLKNTNYTALNLATFKDKGVSEKKLLALIKASDL